METMKVTWKGTVPLLMHSERLADPMDDAAKRLAALTSARGNAKKTEAHVEDVARAEWEGGLYYDEDLGPYIPGFNILACIRDGAKLQRLGSEVIRSVQVVEDRVPLTYPGPRDLDGMWEAKLYDRRGVAVSTAKVMRTRPKFHHWELTFTVAYIEERISRENLERVMRDAGLMVGLGDFNQRFGKFEVARAA